MAEARERQSIECGFCYLKDTDIQDPRVLPCSHIFCRGCLAGQLEHLKVVRCPPCSKVFDVVVDNLPTYKPDVPKHKCDVCTKKGKGDQPAVIYCNSCTKKFCDTHKDEHNEELMIDHVTMTIAEYEDHVEKLEVRYCAEHKEQPYSQGCGVCLTVFCVNCISPLNICTNEKPHELRSLGDLVSRLTGYVDKLGEDMMDKEEKLSALFKETSKYISEYEKETKEMIEKLHETRDKQDETIQTKYIKLEEELRKTRKETLVQMMLFLEEEVGNTLTNLANQRLGIEARLRNSHQVDIVNTHRDTQTEIHLLTTEQLPKLLVDNVKCLAFRDEKGDIEVGIVPTDNIYIGCVPEFSVKYPPKSLSLVKTIEPELYIRSVCHYKGKTYLGTESCTIDVIDSDYNLQTLVPDVEFWPYSITINEDKIYALVPGEPNTINVYDLSGHLITQWKCNDNDEEDWVRHTMIANQIIVPDEKTKRLTIYSLTGEVVKHIDCPWFIESVTAICAADKSSVVVIECSSSTLRRLDINTEEILWTSHCVEKPEAVAMCGKELVCVASEEKVTFINIENGEKVSEMVAEGLDDLVSGYINVDVHEHTLVGSGFPELLFYKIN